MEQWLSMHWEQLTTIAGAAGALGGLAWRLRLGSRLGAALRWIGGEIKTLIYLRMRLATAEEKIANLEERSAIREAYVATLKSQVQDLLQELRESRDSPAGSALLPPSVPPPIDPPTTTS